MKRRHMNKAFWMTMAFFLMFLGFFSVNKNFHLSAQTQVESWKQEIINIDKQIEDLEKMKMGYEAKAIQHANEADRLQFIEGELETAKKHWQIAEANRDVAKKIQSQIDELKAKKQAILDAHKVESFN